jgi:carboxymethylenebutenolidase
MVRQREVNVKRLPEIRITQAMIDAYDEYTHLTLDRRALMRRLTALAGSGAAAAVVLPMLAADKARAAIIDPADSRIRTEEITFKGATGDISAYLAMPANAAGKLPAVLVIHENRGLNPHIEDVARRAATDGFLAMAVDFLSPSGGTPEDEDKAREMIGALDPAQTIANAAAAIEYLKSRPDSNSKVGAVGFCWGGGIVNQLAAAAPGLAAGVAYYGRQLDADKVPQVNAALMLHYAGLDERINAGIEAYKQALEAAGKEFVIHMYEGANHAFNNDTSQARYNKEASDLAWSRTVAFLKEKLA